MRRLPMILALAVAGFLAPPASAQHFTFEVPVELTDLPPDITDASVACYLSSAERGGVMIGQGNARVPLSGGSFSGTLRVPVNATGDPALARSYNCRLFLNGMEALTLFNPPERPGILRYDSRPGTEFAISVIGVITP